MFIVNFIAGNEVAESKIRPNLAEHDGRTDFSNLRDHYEGVGVYAHDITKADHILANIFYSGEKKPHMW